MPDELLKSMEEGIISNFIDRLKQIIFEDDRIGKAETLYLSMDIDKAKETYKKYYP